MKKIFITIIVLAMSTFVQSQDLKWYTNLDEAVDVSMKSNKPLFLFFTGSDWCGWCIRLQNEVFHTKEFTEWAKNNVTLVELDFPRKSLQAEGLKSQNAQMQQIFQVRGYPTVWFTKPTKIDGKTNLEKLGSTGYLAGGPTNWIPTANQILAVGKTN